MFKINKGYFANNVTPFIPEVWARETLALLVENLIAPMLVHRDFENEVAEYGQTVHTRRPKDFKAIRKSKTDSVTKQDTDADSVDVKLDQHLHTSFFVYDLERALTREDLISTYLNPAAIALARACDRIILGQYPHFVNAGQMAGKLNGVTTANIKDYVLDNRQVLDESKCFEAGRNQILTPKTEADVLRPEWFTSADKVGDAGTALREASLGKKLGFDFYKSLNMSNVNTGNTTVSGAINLAAGYVAGSTSLVVDGITGIWAANAWVSINGFPYRIASHTETAGDTTGIVLHIGLKKSVADNDVVTYYTPGTVNFGAGYALGYDKYITVTGFAVMPKVGQIITFGLVSTSTVYTVIDVVGSTILLDRGLEAAWVDTTPVNIGPAGSYNLAIHKNAISFVNRPLPLPKAGALAYVTSYKGVALRLTVTYDGDAQAHLVTFDMLCGVKLLDTNLGSVLLG